MNDNERKTGIDGGLTSYTPQAFTTVDARQMSPDNYESLVFSPSGLTGALPAYQIAALDDPRGFVYSGISTGLGGNPSPASADSAQPLIYDAQFAEAFIRNNSGGGGNLY